MKGSTLITAAAQLCILVATTEAKTVVFFPPPSTSYIIYHTNVAGALISLGHDVWICVPHFLKSKNLVKDKTVKTIDYGEYLGDFEKRAFQNSGMVDSFWKGGKILDPVAFYFYAEEFTKAARQILADKIFIEKIKTLNPDLIVVESIMFNLNMLVLPYMLDIPYALIGPMHNIIISKTPFSPAVPTYPDNNISDNVSFFQRLYHFLSFISLVNFDMVFDSSLVSTFAPHKPYKSINDLAANAEIFLVETDHILDFPRVTFPNTKLIGGFSASPAKQLVGEFKQFMENSKNGVIVMSFGGHVSNLPPHITSKFISAFKKLDLNVVWRVNISTQDPARILTSKWIPQNDLFGHEKTKLFISHCGTNGQYEALYHGVPILCFPIFGDQGYNAEKIQVKQLGLRADMRTASADEIADIIKEIIYNKKFSENMKKTSRMYRELFKIPMKEAAYWLDHVMLYGGGYMRSAAQQMPWCQICALDVIGFLISVVILVIVFIYILIRLCYRCCKRNEGVSKIKQK